jgi:hypothetical protein
MLSAISAVSPYRTRQPESIRPARRAAMSAFAATM